MYDALAELGNPFTDDRADLFALDRKIVPGAEDIKHLYAVEMIGQEQFKSFMDTRILKNNPISDTIVKNNSHADLQMRKFKGKKTHKERRTAESGEKRCYPVLKVVLLSRFEGLF